MKKRNIIQISKFLLYVVPMLTHVLISPGEGWSEAGRGTDCDPQQAERGSALRRGQRGQYRPLPGLHADQGEDRGVRHKGSGLIENKTEVF